ncbi:MAG: ShlB/FhaC/HecB family hemolysin secretion/activation protein [Rubritepida sp.]|nr:ShlB/FhaC/HecB family hemolysin secretion/activation protein [Rubritepida sp.]
MKHRPLLRQSFVSLAIIAAASPVFAQAIPSPPPPGVILRDLAPPVLPRLSPSLPSPPITPRPVTADVERAPVVETVVSGNGAIDTARLRPLVAGLEGRTVTTEEIEDARVALLTYYRQAGYPFLSVTASPQPIAGGFRIQFTILEGRIARARLDGDIGPAGTRVLRFLNVAVTPGPTTRYRLERALLLAGDVPGVTVRGVLRPLEGGAPGELELVGEVTRAAFSGLVTGDNRGFRLTGPVQFLTVGQANSFTSLGERTEAAFFSSAGGESLFGQASTEFFVGGSGLRIRLYAGAGRTAPSGTLAAIGYSAFTRTAGAAVSYPIIRSRSANLIAGVQFDLYESIVDTGVEQPARASRDSLRVVRGGLDGQYLDSVLPLAGAATSIGNIRFHQGINGLGATRPSDLPGPARQGSEFGFVKVTGEFQRTQPLFHLGENMLVSLQATVAGQWTDNVLPSSEKFFLGGTRLGRGFYVGQVSGDRAVAFSAEAQLDVGLPQVSLSPLNGSPFTLRSEAQFYAFYDAGRTYENLVTDPNRRLESWGAGVRMRFNNAIFLDVEGVHRITRQVDAGGAAVRPLPADAAYLRLMTRF